MSDEADQIEITAAMIAAGVDELREVRLGADLADVACEIYLAMELVRRAP